MVHPGMNSALTNMLHIFLIIPISYYNKFSRYRICLSSCSIAFYVKKDKLQSSLSIQHSYCVTGLAHDPTPLPPLEPTDARALIDTELIHVLFKAIEELSFEWSAPEEPTCSRLDEWFLPGCHQMPP